MARGERRLTMVFRPRDNRLAAVLLLLGSIAALWLQSTPSQSLAHRQQPRRLQFREQRRSLSSSSFTVKTFKILQLTDLHMGEGEDTDWGPKQDIRTFEVLDSVIPAEKPDLIVLTGDQLTANDIDQNATAYYRILCEKLKSYQIPWAMVFGNHDDMSLEIHQDDGTILYTNKTKTSREDLYEVDHSFAPLSLTQRGPSYLFGTSNYIINVYDKDEEDGTSLQLLFLDSGGGLLKKHIEWDQLEWFLEEREKNPNVPLVAFQHIPTGEFEYDGEKCTGMHHGGVAPVSKDAGLVDVLEEDGNVYFLAVGHNHGNAYCCAYESSDAESNGTLSLCFGRRSGYGGLGDWDKGARVFEIKLTIPSENYDSDSDDSDDSDSSDDDASSDDGSASPIVTWKSWLRMESGDIIDEYSPYTSTHGDRSFEWW
jgi:predicted phosphodiesterase